MMGMKELEEDITTTVWKIVSEQGDQFSYTKNWSQSRFLNNHLVKQHPYRYHSDKEQELNRAREISKEIYGSGFIIEYETIQKPIRIVPAGEYIDSLFDRKTLEFEEEKKKALKKDLKRKQDKKARERAARKKIFEQLKEEFNE